jgi:hypothetical protein
MPRLEEIEREVFNELDRTCLRVGGLLLEAKEIDPGGFADWVDTKMPFKLDTANRLVAIHVAYRELPAETLAQLPRAWQALFALRAIPQAALVDEIEAGDITPDMTVIEAKKKARDWNRKREGKPRRDPLTDRYSAADLRAGALMDLPATDLNEHVAAALGRWLAARTG